METDERSSFCSTDEWKSHMPQVNDARIYFALSYSFKNSSAHRSLSTERVILQKDTEIQNVIKE